MFDRLEDKEVRRISKAKIDPVIDEDSGDEEDYNFPAADSTKQSRASPPEQIRRSRTPDPHSAAEDTEAASIPATKGLTASAKAVTASVGSALRRNPDGSVAARMILPKRNKRSKVNKHILPRYYLTFASLLASRLGTKDKRADSFSGRI